MAGSLPSRVVHSWWLMTATLSFRLTSSGRNPRPRLGRTPRTSKNSPVTRRPASGTGPSGVSMKNDRPTAAADVAKTPDCCQSVKSGYDAMVRIVPGASRTAMARRSAAAKGSGSMSTALTTLKMAVLAPIPSASVSTATVVNPRCLASIRTPNRRSCQSMSVASAARDWPRRQQATCHAGAGAPRPGATSAAHPACARPEPNGRPCALVGLGIPEADGAVRATLACRNGRRALLYLEGVLEPGSIAHDLEPDRVPDAEQVEPALEIGDREQAVAVHRRDDVPDPDTGACRGARVVHVLDVDPGQRGGLDLAAQVRCQVENREPQPRRPRALLDLEGLVDRHRE